MKIHEEAERIALSDGHNEIAAAVEADFIVIVIENPTADDDEESGGASAITLTRDAATALARWLSRAAGAASVARPGAAPAREF